MFRDSDYSLEKTYYNLFPVVPQFWGYHIITTYPSPDKVDWKIHNSSEYELRSPPFLEKVTDCKF